MLKDVASDEKDEIRLLIEAGSCFMVGATVYVKRFVVGFLEWLVFSSR